MCFILVVPWELLRDVLWHCSWRDLTKQRRNWWRTKVRVLPALVCFQCDKCHDQKNNARKQGFLWITHITNHHCENLRVGTQDRNLEAQTEARDHGRRMLTGLFSMTYFFHTSEPPPQIGYHVLWAGSSYITHYLVKYISQSTGESDGNIFPVDVSSSWVTLAVSCWQKQEYHQSATWWVTFYLNYLQKYGFC